MRAAAFFARLLLALAVLCGPAAAQFSPNLSSVPAFTINQQTALGTPELTFNSFTGVTHRLFHAANGELRLENNQNGLATLVLSNTGTTSFPAWTIAGVDLDYPYTGVFANGSYEHMAGGYGASLGLNGHRGLSFIESSRYQINPDATVPPVQFALQQTGGAFAGTFYQRNAVLDATLLTITINGGGTWPADVNGMTIQEQGDAGFFAKKTTVVSGQGTATLTLNQLPLATSSFVPVILGNLTYGQYTYMAAREKTGIHWYKWNGGLTATTPYMYFDRNNGRVAIGDLYNSIVPVNSLDVLGKVTIGEYNTSTFRSSFAASGVFNISSTAAEIFRVFYGGVNSASIYQRNTPFRWELTEANGATTPITFYFDTTKRTQFGGGLIRAIRVVTAAGAITAATTDDVICVNKSVGAATTVNLYATPATGSVLVVKDCKGDAAANNITITPAAGTLDGAASLALTTNYAVATIQYNGTQWNRIGQ